MTSVEAVQQRYREIHGDHGTTAADDRVLAQAHEPVTDEQALADMAEGGLPMPPYLLSDGRPVALTTCDGVPLCEMLVRLGTVAPRRGSLVTPSGRETIGLDPALAALLKGEAIN